MASVDLHELSGAFALDALDGDELTLFEAHLGECTECRREVERFHVAAAWLASSVETLPPSHLADTVMATVTGRRQATAADRTGDGPPPERPVPDGVDIILPDDQLPADVVEIAGGRPLPLHDVAGTGHGHTRRPTRSQAGRGRRIVVPVAAAVAAAALTAVSVRLVQTDHRLSHYREMAEVAAAPGGQSIELSGSAGKARVLLDRGRNRAVVLSDSLAAINDEQTYELWQFGSGDPKPSGLFRPGSDTKVQHLVDLEVRTDTDGLGVTVEPRKGSLQPTSQAVLSGKLGR